MSTIEQVLWTEKYRPHRISDCILPEGMKKSFQTFVDKGHIPNLLLTGPAGVGKTTVAKAMLDELGLDYIVINGSLNGNIDTLRTDILQFASSVSFSGERKYVILDEADYMNPQSLQPALRNFMEEYAKNCGFILTCNFKNRIIQPLHSRCSVVDFKVEPSDRPVLAVQFLKRTSEVLTKENVEFDKKAVVELITTYFPDWRRVLNELQRTAAQGPITMQSLRGSSNSSLDELIPILKDKEFKAMRKWVAENTDIDSATIFRFIYDVATTRMEPQSVPAAIIILADYQNRAAFVADQEINLASCLTELMRDCNVA